MTEPAYTTQTRSRSKKSKVGALAAASRSSVTAAVKDKPAQPANGVLHHPELPQVTVQFEYVTPEVAKTYIDAIPEWQRNESPSTTNEYTEDFLDGDWLFSGDTLKFTDKGDYVDGQHRAWAIYRSGRSEWMLVVRGLDRAAMRVFDTGYQRKFTNYLQTVEPKIHNVSQVSSVTNKVLDWRRHNYAHSAIARSAQARYRNAKKSHQKLIRTFDSMHHEIVASVKAGLEVRRQMPKTAPDSTFAFAYLYLGRLDPYKRDEFFQLLTNAGGSNDPTHPIRSLYMRLMASVGEHGVMPYNYLAWIFRAWNHWLNDEPLSKDRLKKNRKPLWHTLPIPVDPHHELRSEGWEPLQEDEADRGE